MANPEVVYGAVGAGVFYHGWNWKGIWLIIKIARKFACERGWNMKIAVESLISFEEWIQSPEKVMEMADSMGEVVVLKDNKPAYYIQALSSGSFREEQKQIPNGSRAVSEKKTVSKKKLTLKAAAVQVLKSAENGELHVSELADAIFDQGLYTKRDGSKAPYTQVRAMCGQYKQDFEALPGNRVKLIIKTTK